MSQVPGIVHLSIVQELGQPSLTITRPEKIAATA